ncbi:carboxymuconolactone decarboxylase family protein [Mesorhizobium sp. C280B]|uniref:carboxymuconolactone decarboxylase family protein n=1 Tax=unclassified Mesorhizobium TaxID=325217 RepID=UPI000415663D|nr:carboxymuconolactone decarboxylase family protein [Mesorhizobium sp. LSJC280B00]
MLKSTLKSLVLAAGVGALLAIVPAKGRRRLGDGCLQGHPGNARLGTGHVQDAAGRRRCRRLGRDQGRAAQPKHRARRRGPSIPWSCRASQIPCQYCIYFHTQAAKLNGASDEEIKEAVAMAAIVRHWSTMLNGSQVDLATFKKQSDEVFAAVKAKSQ